MAAEKRRMLNLPEDARVTLVEGSEEWQILSARVRAVSDASLEQEMGKHNPILALTCLVDTVKLRIRAYPLLAQATDMALRSWGVTEIWCQGVYTRKVGAQISMGCALPQQVLDLFPYVRAFPDAVAALTEQYPHAELLESARPLLANARNSLQS